MGGGDDMLFDKYGKLQNRAVKLALYLQSSPPVLLSFST